MNTLAKRFIDLSEKNRNLYEQALIKEDEDAFENFCEEFNEYLFTVFFVGYIKKCIKFASIDTIEKENKVGFREKLILNSNNEESKNENLEFMLAQTTDFDDEIMNNLNDIFEDDILNAAIRNLTSRQKDVLSRYILEDKSEIDIAKELNVSTQSINKIKNTALNKLKIYLEKHHVARR